MTTEPAEPPSQRIVSLDQFRGYTVLGMLVVNFLSGFDAMPLILKHRHTYCSYADTIMPQFFFAVGFAYRLTLLKNRTRVGTRAAYRHVVVRNLGLIVFGLVLYGLDVRVEAWRELVDLGPMGFLRTAFQRHPFQALVHIGITALWVMPVMGAAPAWRIGFAVASAALHSWLSHRFYFEFAWKRPVIDGGPLGFLTWTMPLIAGSLAFDALNRWGARRALLPMIISAIVLMVLAQAITGLSPQGMAPPPFVPPPPERQVDPWTMSQRAGGVTYLLFASGLSLAVYSIFVVCADIAGCMVPLFRTFGQNALVAYVLHGIVDEAVTSWVPDDAPLWYVLTGLAIYLILCWLFVRHLERQRIFIRM